MNVPSAALAIAWLLARDEHIIPIPGTRSTDHLREAAMGVGASPVQVVFHHVVPMALPGILTGTIIGLAQALGETAPLLLIGMVAFVREYPAAPPEVPVQFDRVINCLCG